MANAKHRPQTRLPTPKPGGRRHGLGVKSVVPTPDAAPTLEQITSLTREEIAGEFAAAGQPAFRVGQLLDWVYRKRVRSFEAMTNLPAGLRTFLAGRFTLGTIETVRKLGSHDTTQKFSSACRMAS